MVSYKQTDAKDIQPKANSVHLIYMNRYFNFHDLGFHPSSWTKRIVAHFTFYSTRMGNKGEQGNKGSNLYLWHFSPDAIKANMARPLRPLFLKVHGRESPPIWQPGRQQKIFDPGPPTGFTGTWMRNSQRKPPGGRSSWIRPFPLDPLKIIRHLGCQEIRHVDQGKMHAAKSRWLLDVQWAGIEANRQTVRTWIHELMQRTKPPRRADLDLHGHYLFPMLDDEINFSLGLCLLPHPEALLAAAGNLFAE